MQLTCICENMESAASLDLKMSYYVFQRSPNIRMVYIQHCSELYVRLDFRGVDSTNFPVYFRSIQSLHIGNGQILSYFSQCSMKPLFVQKIIADEKAKKLKIESLYLKLRTLTRKVWNFLLKNLKYLNILSLT